jgi:membrane protease YdiL (CAAX protease family)
MLANAGAPQVIEADSIWRYLLSWAVIAGAGGVVLLPLQWLVPARGFFPGQRTRAVPWGFGAVVIATMLGMVWSHLLLAMLPMLWANAVGSILGVVAVVFFLHQATEALPYQLGLTTQRWARNLAIGYLFWLLVTPAVFGIYRMVLEVEPAAKHPIEDLLRKQATVETWLLATAVAVLLGPILEELLFRGVIQPWMVRSTIAADLVAIAFGITGIVIGSSEVISTGRLQTWWLLLLVLLAGPGYLAFEWLTRRWLPRAGAARAIYASSLLFALIHYNAWPTPIPLFFLSLALGYVAYRTQSLLGPILMHGLFNAVSLLALGWQGMGAG